MIRPVAWMLPFHALIREFSPRSDLAQCSDAGFFVEFPSCFLLPS